MSVTMQKVNYGIHEEGHCVTLTVSADSLQGTYDGYACMSGEIKCTLSEALPYDVVVKGRIKTGFADESVEGKIASGDTSYSYKFGSPVAVAGWGDVFCTAMYNGTEVASVKKENPGWLVLSGNPVSSAVSIESNATSMRNIFRVNHKGECYFCDNNERVNEGENIGVEISFEKVNEGQIGFSHYIQGVVKFSLIGSYLPDNTGISINLYYTELCDKHWTAVAIVGYRRINGKYQVGRLCATGGIEWTDASKYTVTVIASEKKFYCSESELIKDIRDKSSIELEGDTDTLKMSDYKGDDNNKYCIDVRRLKA